MSGLKLSDVLSIVDRSDKVITDPYREWLLEYGDAGYPQAVQERMAAELAKVPRIRSGSFSGSSAGSCTRAQVLSYLGLPGVHSMDPTLLNLFSDGKWRHLRWQANLLAAGILNDIEVSAPWQKMRAKGSMDGTGIVPATHANKSWRNKTFGFELKGVNPFLFKKIADTQEDQVLPAFKIEHKQQVHRYFLTSRVDLFIIVYEDKATQNWIEWVIEPDDDFVEESRRELVLLNRAVDRKSLPHMLTDCRKSKGDLFWNDCPFGTLNGPCVATRNWPEPNRPKRKKVK